MGIMHGEICQVNKQMLTNPSKDKGVKSASRSSFFPSQTSSASEDDSQTDNDHHNRKYRKNGPPASQNSRGRSCECTCTTG